MPRPKKPGAPGPKKRSRNGCWPCKNRKVKCGEEHPQCDNCQKAGIECDYSVRLNWLENGNYRPGKKRKLDDAGATLPNQNTLLARLSPPNQGRNELLLTTRFRDAAPPPSHTGAPSMTSVKPTATDSARLPVVFDAVDQPRPISFSGSSLQASVADGLTDTFQKDASDSHDPDGVPTAETARSGIAGVEAGRRDDDSAAVGAALSPRLSREKVRHGPVDIEGAVEGLPWSPSSASDTRAWLRSTFSLPSEPSPFTSVSTPGGEDECRGVSRTTPYLPSSSDISRLSVQSLLTAPHDATRPSDRTFSGPDGGSHHGLSRALTPESSTFYGYDNGKPDKDLGRNDDGNAIMGYSAIGAKTASVHTSEDATRGSRPSDFGLGMRDTGNYYERRVEVWISKAFEPLPPRLQHNPMDLLYFHHFLNHTARVLVPHDDLESNPFRTVLPQMAVKHDNLLSLLLAYSASHRARHLKYPEPSLRIAHLVQGVIADLRSLVQQSMDDPATVISTADLAAAIMLASLEIISPAAIGGSIPWHHHLNLARELISRMPDGLRRIQLPAQENCVRSLLWSWFAYLDVLGSLSGGPGALLTPSCYTTGGPPSPAIPQGNGGPAGGAWDEDMERIDCILGFTPRCVFILARIFELARRCEEARLRSPSWTPDSATQAAAAVLEMAALRSLAAPSRPCGHVHAPSPLRRWDRTQMAAGNRAFHHAALIHLHRRVLGKSSAHPDVWGAAQSVLECLELVERGSSAETCLLFPMFTAGCELADPVERADILERIVSVERTGMMQVQQARKLMEKVWQTGQPWETLVDTEFIG